MRMSESPQATMKHGGDLTEAMRRHGAGDPPWLDLSTGINPHPWRVPDPLRREGWERLPGAADLEGLLAAAKVAYRVPDGAGIVAAPGTQALIQWLPRLAPPGEVAVLGPTYGEHADAWRMAGAPVREVDDLEAAPSARHRVVVRPNNPDGRLLEPDALRLAASACARAGGWLVVDESFADIDPAAGAAALVPELPVVILRSFGKFYGLAGLRLGFAVARPEIADAIGRALGPWAVSGPALAVGAAALADGAWADRMRVRLAEEAAAIDEVLGAGGLAPAGGTSLYRLVSHREATLLHEALAAEHIWCRAFAWDATLLRFGLPPDANGLDRLAAALGRFGTAAHAHGITTASPR